MTVIQFTNSSYSLPDMQALTQSIKDIRRAVPTAENLEYSYFIDNVKMAATVADGIDTQIRDALSSLPVSLESLESVKGVIAGIAKINSAEKAGAIDSSKAAVGRDQLLGKLSEGISSTLTSFNDSSTALATSAERFAQNSKKIDVRLTEAMTTETANQKRAKADSGREGKRLTTLETRLSVVNDAVDEKRGGPTEDLRSLIPDEKELSSLLDVDPEDAAATEVAVAKKTVELAVAEIRKVLEVIDKTIAYEQVVKIRDELYEATEAQRQIVYAANERLRKANALMGKLEALKASSDAMETAATEIQKMVTAFTSFTNDLKNLGGQQISETTVSDMSENMASYLEQIRIAQSKVILT